MADINWEQLIYNPEIIVRTYFKNDEGKPLELTPYQTAFLRDVLLKKNNKIIFCASTRSGKSEVISIAIILLALIYPNEEITVVSATWAQSQIIFLKAKQHLRDSPTVFAQVDISNEFSKQEFNIINHSTVKCMSAGGSSKGEGLLGFGSTILVLDESGSIEDEIYYQKILRMIATGRRPRMIIESGTPHRKNHFYETWTNPDYKKYHVTWRDAVDAGQINEEEIKSLRQRLSEIEFKMWYEAEFPDEAEDSLFKYKDVLNAQEAKIEGEGIRVLGVDVARFGIDITVFIVMTIINNLYRVDDIQIIKKSDLMQVVGKIVTLDREYKFTRINVDVIGVGSGVVDRLAEIESVSNKINPAHYGESPTNEEDRSRFSNKKAQQYFRLKKIFEEGRISIPANKTLIDELLAMRYEFTSSGKLKIIDPEKSPDYADALVYAIWFDETGFILDW